MGKFWKVWVLGVLRGAGRQALQTAAPVLGLALTAAGSLTGWRALVALAAGVGTAAGVTVGRYVIGAVLSIRLPVGAPGAVRVAVKATSAGVGVVAASWPLDWAGFHGIAWPSVLVTSAVAVVLSLVQSGLDLMPETTDSEPVAQIAGAAEGHASTV